MVENHLSQKPDAAQIVNSRPSLVSLLIVIAGSSFLSGCFDGTNNSPSANNSAGGNGVAENKPPVADAGPNATVPKYVEVILDARGSTDPNLGDLDRDPLTGVPTYQWEFVAVPAPFTGDPATEWSTAALPGEPGAPLPVCEPRGLPYPEPADDFDCDEGETPVKGLARFTPDNGGIFPASAVYTIRVTVTDWIGASSTADVTYTASFNANQPPTVDAGPPIGPVDWDPDADLTLDVPLDGATADDVNDPGCVSCTYEWRVDNFVSSVSPITRENPAIDDSTLLSPTITLDDIYQIGEYTYELTVDDGTFKRSDKVTVTVSKIAPAGIVLLSSALIGLLAIGWRYKRRRQSQKIQS